MKFKTKITLASRDHAPQRPTKFFVWPKTDFTTNWPDSSGCDNAKDVQFQVGFAHDLQRPMTSVRGLCWGFCPHNPIIGSRSAFPVWPQNSGSGSASPITQ